MNLTYKKAVLIFSILLLAMVFLPCQLNAQHEQYVIDGRYSELTWEEFVKKAEKEFDLNFYYSIEDTKNIKLDAIIGPIQLVAYIEKNLIKYDLYISLTQVKNIFITNEGKIVTELPTDIYPAIKFEQKINIRNEDNTSNFIETKKEHLARTIEVGSKQKGLKSKQATLSGYLFDLMDSSALLGATIMIEELGIGTAADENGFYKLRMEKGNYTLVINEINHSDQKIRLKLFSSGKADFYLESTSVTLEGVVVTSERYDRVQNNKMGFEQISTKFIKEIPLVLGERDILKVATLLPGIQIVGEGSSGFNVRGSPADQNLFYIDHVPIYNTSHLFGFFSVFNSDAISEFALSKSNIPAKFGGRLASIFDITAKEGNNKQVKLRGGISPITGSLLLEGPIQKDKSSFMLGLRSTYSNWILKLIKNPDFKNSKVFFGDAIVKLNFNINQNNRIQAFGYYSLDDIDFAGKTLFNTSNEGASLSWKRFFNRKNNLDLSLIYSRYSLDAENYEVAFEAYRQNNILTHKEAKLDFILRPGGKNSISFGANAILYQIDRGEFSPVGEQSLIIAKNLGEEKGIESGIFASGEWNPFTQLSLTGGLRFNWYSYLGPQSVYTYQENQLKEEASIIDTLQFGNYEPISSHSGLDYRLAAKYSFNTRWSIKASYNKLHQYIFLLSNTIALAPTDKWKLSDYHIEPMVGEQVSLGVYTYLWDKKFEFSVEAYLKNVNELVEFRDGADLLVNEVPEWDVLQGKLDVYGLEFMLKKSSGRFNGWMNYTYSKANILVDNGQDIGQINFGNTYPANHDKPHSLNIVANYKIQRRVSLSTNLVYSTGKPITYPTTVYYQGGILLVNFTSRNKYRLPDYMRMDLSLKVEGNLKAKKFMHGVWVFSIYNLLGRDNIYNAYFRSETGSLRGYKVSIFANPVFSVSYNFKFGNYDY